MKKYFAVVIIFILVHNTIAQTRLLDFSKKNYGLIVRKLSEADGFPNAIVQEFIHDRNGFFWFATGSGLIKYDGISSEIFDTESTPQLQNSAINHINEDHDGNIWFSHHVRGISIIRNKEIYSFGVKDNLPEVTASKIFTDHSGNTWIGTLQNGLYKYTGSKFQHIIFPPNRLLNNILSITNYNKDTILVGTGFGLLKVAGNSATNFNPPDLPSAWCRTLFIDSKQQLWIGTNKGLAVYLGGKRIYKNLFPEFSNDLIIGFNEDDDGNIWIATYNRGLFLFNYDAKKIFPLNTEHGLTNDKVISFKIMENSIWIAPRTGGIDLLKPATFEVISAHNGLSDEFVNCIYEDSPNNFIAGTSRGLYNIVFNSNSYRAEKNFLLPNEHIYFIERDKRQNLLVATRASGLHIFSNNSHKVYNMTNILRVNFVRSIFVDDDNSYWVGTNGAGICIINGDSAEYLDQAAGLKNLYCSFVFKNKNSDFIVGTSGGGLYFIRDKKVYLNLNEKSGLSNSISGFYEEADGTIWLSSPEKGIMRIKNSVIQTVQKKDGLHTNNINNIIFDGDDKFWLSTQSGIFSVSKKEIERFFDKKTSKVTSDIFGIADGMLTETCSFATQLSAKRMSDGNIMFSTLKGLVVVEPHKILKRKQVIDAYISKINWNEFELSQEKEIGPGVNRLELNFSAKTTVDPRFMKFRYKLEPVDASFSATATTNRAVYNNLSYGDYNFILIASKGSETSSSDTLQYNFTIRPYIYETLLFKIISGIVLAISISLMVVFMVKRSYSKKISALEAQHHLEKERIRISKDMHDELGAIVTRINLLSEVGKQNVGNTTAIQGYLNQISETGIELASTMDEIVWAVNPGNDRVDKLIFYIVQFAENILSLAAIELSISIPDEIEEKFIPAEIRHNIFLIVKESINNIIKHSHAKNVQLSARVKNSMLEFSIEDDGKGFDTSSIDQFSNGVENLKQRASNIHGEIIINSKLKEGTKIFLTVSI